MIAVAALLVGIFAPDFYVHWTGPTRDALTVFATGVGVVVAILGLRTWRQQLHGTARFEVSCKLLRKARDAQNAFGSFRLPLMNGAELAAALRKRNMPEPASVGDREAFDKGHRFAKIDRFELVFKAMRECEEAALDAEVVLGSKIKEAFFVLRRCYHDAQLALEYVEEAEGDEAKGYRRILSGVDEDDFGLRIEQAVEAIRSLTEPHIQARFAV